MNAKQRNQNRATSEALHYSNQELIVRGGRHVLQRTPVAEKVKEVFDRSRSR